MPGVHPSPIRRLRNALWTSYSSDISGEWLCGVCGLRAIASLRRISPRKVSEGLPASGFVSGDSKFSTWLYSIARNHCFNEIKSRALAPSGEVTEGARRVSMGRCSGRREVRSEADGSGPHSYLLCGYNADECCNSHQCSRATAPCSRVLMASYAPRIERRQPGHDGFTKFSHRSYHAISRVRESLNKRK